MTQSLIVGVDGRELLGERTGVGRYLAELMKQWAAAPEADGIRFHVYVPHDLTRQADTDWLPRSDRVEIRTLPGGGGVIWEQVTLARAANLDRVDRFFAPAFTAPLRVTAPLILTIHDISFVAHPEWFGPREGLRRRLVTRWSASRADIVLTDTEFSRSEIRTLLDVPASRLRVIRPGITRGEGEGGRGKGKGDGKEEREQLVLFVGSILDRRHVPDLIRAFSRVVRRYPGASLEIVGANRTTPRQDLAAIAAATGFGHRMRLRNYVSESELASLYRRARVFGFLSEYEGFGFTPLEALAAGVPGVVLDTPVAREVCGDAAVYVARPDDYAAVGAAIESLLVDGIIRDAVLTRGRDVLSRYSWEHAARETLEAIVSGPSVPSGEPR